jgi:ribosomal-protein-alanine N-acetyltransferase
MHTDCGDSGLFALESDRLQMIPLYKDNLRLLIEDRQKMEENLGLVISNVENEDSVKDAMKTSLQNVTENTEDYLWFTFWVIVLKEENRIIGGLCFKNRPNNNGEVEIGYGIQEEYRCKGYMTEALKEIIRWAFAFDCVSAVIAETEKTNLPSHRVLEKVGMRNYGKRKKMIWWKIEKMMHTFLSLGPEQVTFF